MKNEISDRSLKRILKNMPKAELHLHLDGSLRVETALKLARKQGLDAPNDYNRMHQLLTAPKKATTQMELLKHFELPIKLLQDYDSLEMTTFELVESKANDHVRYMEIRWAPALHTAGGLSVKQVIEAVCSGIERGMEKTGAIVNLICTAVRGHSTTDNIQLARTAADFKNRGMVGFDLAGLEASYPDPLSQLAAFNAAREAGLQLTFHIGEVPGSLRYFKEALQTIKPGRIAHGICAIEDPELCRILNKSMTALDLCPTSNFQAGIVSDIKNFPAAQLFRRDVPVTINTDDPVISEITMSDEYFNMIKHTDLTIDELWQINLQALKSSFMDNKIKKILMMEFTDWAKGIPEISS